MKKPSPPPQPPSLTSLPDEILVNCLARIRRSQYPRLSLVCKTFKSLLSSPELEAARSRLVNPEKSLYLSLWDLSNAPLWFTLCINNPNRDVIKNKKKKKAGAWLLSLPSSDSPSVSNPIVVGSEIYVIGGGLFDDGGPSSAVRVLDCRSNTWRHAPSMNVARKHRVSCVYDGKIYVFGGLDDEDEESSFGEVFDTKTQSWECLPDPCSAVRSLSYYKGAEFDGKFYWGYKNAMYAYDTKQGKWERCDGLIAKKVPRLGCVIDNVSYSFRQQCGFCWYDVKDRDWKEVKGVESLEKMYKSYGDSSFTSFTKVFSFGGKLLAIWEEYKKYSLFFLERFHRNKKIWCAEISLEKRQGGEVWGNVEWVDVVHTAPAEYKFLHCVAVSV